MRTPRTNKLTLWMVLLGVVGVIWAVLPLLQGSDPAPATPTTSPAVDNTWVPEPPAEAATETTPAPAAGLEPPADQPTLAAVPFDTPTETLESLAEAVEARLVSELIGVGRDKYGEVVWRTAPCCVWVTVTGLVADFSNPELVRVMVEWETDVGEGSGPTYWTTDPAGSWVPASVESSS